MTDVVAEVDKRLAALEDGIEAGRGYIEPFRLARA